ncbi:MAG: hypothetical protein ACE14P_09080 [Methanotrichaceae archaeon]
MAQRRSIIVKLMAILLGAIILLPVCLGSEMGSEMGSTFDAKSKYIQTIAGTGQVTQDSDFNSGTASFDLTGTWDCNDGNKYYIRQIGDTFAWLGESPDKSRTSVAYGKIAGNIIELNWMDVPEGSSLGSGSLTLEIESNDKISLIQQSGGFSGTEWTRPHTYEMSDLKMTGKRIDSSVLNSSAMDLHPSFPDLFMSSSQGKTASGIELVSLNPQPEPPIPPIDPLKTSGNNIL